MGGTWFSISAAEAHAWATPKNSTTPTLRFSRGSCLPSPELSFGFRPWRLAVLSAPGWPLPAAPLPACSWLLRGPELKPFHVAAAPPARSPLWPHSPRPVLARFFLRTARAVVRLHVPNQSNRAALRWFYVRVAPVGLDRGGTGPYL